MLKILNVVGARPNFVKIAPLYQQMAADPDLSPYLVHTGQHYDRAMSQIFFEQLGLPQPDLNLGVRGNGPVDQIAAVMAAFEPVLLDLKPDLVLVVGDVNSTAACALAAAHHQIPIAHVEAGLRSFDRTMPEELNRILTDHLAQFHFVTEESGMTNLKNEGLAANAHLVGNVMIDTLVQLKDRIHQCDILDRLALKPGAYGLVTLHRGENVDNPSRFEDILNALATVSQKLPLVFPIHPRTRDNAARAGMVLDGRPHLRTMAPAPYLEFLKLTHEARLVITDSGGIQEETTWLGLPCLTLRHNTERPITLTLGTNQLVPPEGPHIIEAVDKVLAAPLQSPRIPPLWDGRTAQRIVTILKDALG